MFLQQHKTIIEYPEDKLKELEKLDLVYMWTIHLKIKGLCSAPAVKPVFSLNNLLDHLQVAGTNQEQYLLFYDFLKWKETIQQHGPSKIGEKTSSVLNKVLLSEMRGYGKLLRSLYKYYAPTDYNFEALRQKYLWFSSFSVLNDPFEGQIDMLDYDSINIDSISPILGNYDLPLPPGLPIETKTQMVDTLRNETKLEKHSARIFSMSSDSVNIAMWSHYADKHSGFCVEFDPLQGATVFEVVLPVIYEKNYPKNLLYSYQELYPGAESSRYNHRLFTAYIDNISRTKSELWGYEKEYRAIRLDRSKREAERTEDEKKGTKYYYSDPGVIKSIIFGLRTPQKTKDKICEILKDRGDYGTVTLKQIVQIKNAFALKIEDYTPRA